MRPNRLLFDRKGVSQKVGAFLRSEADCLVQLAATITKLCECEKSAYFAFYRRFKRI
jgi:hypothetical protein